MYDVKNISFNFRVIVGILDAFHFDLRNSQHAVVNLPDAIAKKKAKGEITGKGYSYNYSKLYMHMSYNIYFAQQVRQLMLW